ncbi:MAG: hypothetical protein AB7V32_07085, partial [Candidatus Berkiella sp.]
MLKKELLDIINAYDERKGLKRKLTGDTPEIVKLKAIYEKLGDMHNNDILPMSVIYELHVVCKNNKRTSGATFDSIKAIEINIEHDVHQAIQNHLQLQVYIGKYNKLAEDLKKQYFELGDRIEGVQTNQVIFESDTAIKQELAKWEKIYDSIPGEFYGNMIPVPDTSEVKKITENDPFASKQRKEAEERFVALRGEFWVRYKPYRDKLREMASIELQHKLNDTQQNLSITQRELETVAAGLRQKAQEVESVAAGLRKNYNELASLAGTLNKKNDYIMQVFGSDTAIILEQTNDINALLEGALKKAQETITRSSRNTLTFSEGSKTELLKWASDAIKGIIDIKMNSLTAEDLRLMRFDLSDRLKIMEKSPYIFLRERESKINALIQELQNKMKENNESLSKMTDILTSLITAQFTTSSALKAVKNKELSVFHQLIESELLKAGMNKREISTMFG